jgi:hypothetical protein
MTTFTLNRNFDTADFLLVALNEYSYEDLKASKEMDSQRMRWGDERKNHKSVKNKMKMIFTKLAA